MVDETNTVMPRPIIMTLRLHASYIEPEKAARRLVRPRANVYSRRPALFFVPSFEFRAYSH